MAAAHTATLKSSAAILAALRKAHQCQQGLLAGREPNQLEAAKLPSLAPASYVTDLLPSPDGRLCAVVYGNPLIEDFGEDTEYGVCLYASQTGRLLRTICKAKDVHAVHWSACSSFMGVVVEGHGKRSAVLYEAATGRSMGPAWCSEAAAALAEEPYKPFTAVFSPDCKRLLVIRWREGYQQRMYVLEMHQGSLVARVNMAGHACNDHDSSRERYADVCILWHPSSHGLLVPGCHWVLLDPQDMLHKAEVIVGHCPPPAYLNAEPHFRPAAVCF